MLWDHNMKDNLFLLFQVFAMTSNQSNNYNQGPMSSANYEPIGYTVFTVNNEDGTIRFGTFEQPLYNMPINIYK